MKYLILLLLVSCAPKRPNKEQIELANCICKERGERLESATYDSYDDVLSVSCSTSIITVSKYIYFEGCSK